MGRYISKQLEQFIADPTSSWQTFCEDFLESSPADQVLRRSDMRLRSGPDECVHGTNRPFCFVAEQPFVGNDRAILGRIFELLNRELLGETSDVHLLLRALERVLSSRPLYGEPRPLPSLFQF